MKGLIKTPVLFEERRVPFLPGEAVRAEERQEGREGGSERETLRKEKKKRQSALEREKKRSRRRTDDVEPVLHQAVYSYCQICYIFHRKPEEE
jgi:hypothetical protein